MRRRGESQIDACRFGANSLTRSTSSMRLSSASRPSTPCCRETRSLPSWCRLRVADGREWRGCPPPDIPPPRSRPDSPSRRCAAGRGRAMRRTVVSEDGRHGRVCDAVGRAAAPPQTGLFHALPRGSDAGSDEVRISIRRDRRLTHAGIEPTLPGQTGGRCRVELQRCGSVFEREGDRQH